MVAALHIAEILEHICEYAEDGTLCVMARTARILHEPAIRIMWHDLPSLAPLLQCFPANAWTGEGNQFQFTRILIPQDWTAILKYASRVRRFVTIKDRDWPAAVRYGVDAAVWEMVCCLRPVTVLFPQLRWLSWGTLRLQDRLLPSVLNSIGEHLSSIKLQGFSHSKADAATTLEASFRIIAERFPVLRVVDVGSSRDVITDSQLGTTIATLACNFATLVSFTSPHLPITPAAMLKLLSGTPRLRSLTVRLQKDALWPSEHIASCAASPLALRLRVLQLYSSTQTYIAFGQVATLLRVASFALWLVDQPPAHSIPELFASIRRQCSPAVLRKIFIRMSTTTSKETTTNEASIFPVHLRPLLEFDLLKRLRLEIQCRYALDDECYTDMANAWPRIRTLYVGCDKVCVHDVLPSVRALAMFAVHCPSLEYLGLVFNAERWVTENDFDADDAQVDVYGPLAHRPSTSAVHRLRVGASTIRSPEYTAAFLVRIFPGLTNIFDHSDWLSRKPWEEARRFLNLFRRIKRDERCRYTQELAAKDHGTAAGHREVVAVS